MENDGYDNRGAGANLNTDEDVTVTFLPLVDSERKLLDIHFLSAQEVSFWENKAIWFELLVDAVIKWFIISPAPSTQALVPRKILPREAHDAGTMLKLKINQWCTSVIHQPGMLCFDYYIHTLDVSQTIYTTSSMREGGGEEPSSVFTDSSFMRSTLAEALVCGSKVKTFVCFPEWKRGAAGEAVARMAGLLRDRRRRVGRHAEELPSPQPPPGHADDGEVVRQVPPDPPLCLSVWWWGRGRWGWVSDVE